MLVTVTETAPVTITRSVPARVRAKREQAALRGGRRRQALLARLVHG